MSIFGFGQRVHRLKSPTELFTWKGSEKNPISQFRQELEEVARQLTLAGAGRFNFYTWFNSKLRCAELYTPGGPSGRAVFASVRVNGRSGIDQEILVEGSLLPAVNEILRQVFALPLRFVAQD